MEKGKEFSLGKCKIELVGNQMLLGSDNDVHSGHLVLMEAEHGPQNTFNAIAGDGIAAFFCDSKTQTPHAGRSGRAAKHDEILREAAFSPVIAGLVFRPVGNPPFSGPGQ